MKKDRKIIISLIIVAILVGGYYFFFAKKQAEMQQPAKQEVSKGDLVIKGFVDKYQATIGDEIELAYTIQAQKRFITGKPTLFTSADVDDIFERNGKTFIRFSSSWLTNNNYSLELECNGELVDKILRQKENDPNFDFYGSYAVVANIQEVSNPVFALSGTALSEDEVEIDISSSDLFIAKGVCIDIAYIEEERMP